MKTNQSELNSLLVEAAKNNWTFIVNEVLNRGADITHNNYAAFRWAEKNQSVDVLDWLRFEYTQEYIDYNQQKEGIYEK